MRRNNLFTKFIVSLALVALLLSGSRAMSAFALAQEITPELEPVYDTEVVSLQDYVDNVLTDAQVAVFNTLLGSYVASQAGLNEYDLEYPYNDRTGVIGWLQDAGMKLYNDIISLGQYDLVTGTDLRTYILKAASYAIGMAQKAHTYTDMNDFLDDVDNSTHYFVPIDPVLQASINSYFGRDYGLWNWQFDTKPFTSSVVYKTTTVNDLLQTQYNTQYANYSSTVSRPVRSNALSTSTFNFFNCVCFHSVFDTYRNIFINSSNNTIYLASDSGDFLLSNLTSTYELTFYSRVGTSSYQLSNGVTSIDYHNLSNISFNPNTYSTYKELVNALYNGNLTSRLFYFEDFVTHVYVGSNWATKQEIFNITDLNFSQNNSPSYNQVPDESYIDLKGFLTDIVNNTNILNVILDNLFKPDGTLNVDPALVKVSITIPDTNPLPVNLNEIQSYTNNEYLTLIKEHATNFGETIGEYVAFWHNSDAELTYTILGSFIIIMIGAFIGKWGHS